MARKRKQKKNDDGPESPGQFLIAIGGFMGFAIVFIGGYYLGGLSLNIALLGGALSCLLLATTMKWIAVYIEKNIDQIRRERVEAIRWARKQEEEAEERQFDEDSGENSDQSSEEKTEIAS